MVLCSQHLEALPVILGPLILKQEAKRAVLDCNAHLALPKAASFQIPGIGDEGIVCPLSQEFVVMEVILDDAEVIQVSFGILHCLKLERLCRSDDGRGKSWRMNTTDNWKRGRGRSALLTGTEILGKGA